MAAGRWVVRRWHTAAGQLTCVPFAQAKIATARFFADHMLTTASGLAASVAGGSAGTLALEVEQF
jgi:hypothetical protein